MTPDTRAGWRSTRLFAASVLALGLCLLLAAAIFAASHRWRYDHVGRVLVRTDTWTGHSEALSPREGWRRVP